MIKVREYQGLRVRKEIHLDMYSGEDAEQPSNSSLYTESSEHHFQYWRTSRVLR